MRSTLRECFSFFVFCMKKFCVLREKLQKEQFERKVHALEMLHKGDAKTSILYHYEEGSEPVPAEEYGCEAGTLARVLIDQHRRCQKLEEMLEQVENGA